MVVEVKMTPALRAVSLGLLVVSTLVFCWFGVELLHLVSYPFLDRPSLAAAPTGKASNYLWNGGLLVVFFIQHFTMASFGFKKMMAGIYPLYPLFERYFFNIVAGSLFLFVIRHLELGNQVLFELPKIVLVLQAYGWLMFGASVVVMMQNLLWPFSISDIISKDTLKFEIEPTKKKRGLTMTGPYGICRNPMYSGMLGVFIGASQVITIDRLVFDIIVFAGIYYGVLREQAKMKQEFEDYDEYCRKVPNRFIPALQKQ